MYAHYIHVSYINYLLHLKYREISLTFVHLKILHDAAVFNLSHFKKKKRINDTLVDTFLYPQY